MEGYQYGCSSCSAPKSKFGGRKRAGSMIAGNDSMVDSYALLRDTLARKHIRDPTKNTTTKKYGASRRRAAARRKAAARRARARAPVHRRRYGCGRY